MNKKLILCISAIILIILGITVINNINKKEDGITANNAEKFEKKWKRLNKFIIKL